MSRTGSSGEGSTSTSPVHDLALGARFADRYEVEACVGRGAMGVVYQVFDHEVGARVALKVVSLGDARASVDRFRREVRLARTITSRHVARIHDLGEHGRTHFLSMEFVDGPSLEALLRDGPLVPERAARLAIQIGLGLEAAHGVDVVHRDLKPANVLVERPGQADERGVLTDFGIARALGEERLTQEAHALIGTPAYMAPEQVLGEPVDARTDLYAFGLTFYEMLTGTLPFLDGAEGALAVALARCRRAPADPRTWRAVPDPLAELVMRCLATLPTGRPRGVREVLDALRAWLAEPSAIGVSVGHPSALFDTVSASGFTLAPSPSAEPAPSRGSQVIAEVPFAPIPAIRAALAVLPFRVRGDDEDALLADGLHEALIDVLSRTHGLRVASSGVMDRFRDERDPLAIGRALSVDAVVDGSVQRAGQRLRVTVRLLDARTGDQRWSERHDVAPGDALALEDVLGGRITESLRVELATGAVGSRAAPEAVQLYLSARREMRTGDFAQWDVALSLLERALVLSPDFGLALAAHAVATLRAWWTSGAGSHEWAGRAQASVDRALARAPEFPESHLAVGMLAVQHGDLVRGVTALARALDLAPTFAEAQTYLGELQCEAGRVDEGVRRLRLALDLEPQFVRPHFALARIAALRGDPEGMAEHMAAVDRVRGRRGLGPLTLRLRVAAWQRDAAAVRALVDEHAADPDPMIQGVLTYGRYFLGELTDLGPFRGAVRAKGNPRMRSLLGQLAAESHGLRGEDDLAFEMVRESATAALVDLDWLERCPALERIRSRPEYLEVLAVVRARASALWSV